MTSDWPLRPLGELALVVDCEHKTAPACVARDAYGYSIGTPNIKDGRIDYTAAKRVSHETFEAWSRRAVLGAGDLVLAREAPVGQVGRVDPDKPTCLGQRTVLIRPNQDLVTPAFLHSWLLAAEAQSWMAARSAGSTVAHLNVADVREIPVRVPPFEEQQQISRFLNAFNQLAEQNRLLIALLEQLIAEHFAAEGFDTDGDARFSDFVEVNPRYPKPTGSAPYVDMAALPTSSALIGGVAERAAAGGARFTTGDSLMARITPCLENGKAAYVDKFEPGEVAVGSTEFLVFRARQGVPRHWPYFFTRSPRFRAYAAQHMTGSSGRQRCSAESIERFAISPPEPDALKRFEGLAEPMFEAMRELSDESALLESVRDELLPLLMSGRVRIEETAA